MASIRTMIARRQSNCPDCGNTIRPGDTIVKASGSPYWSCCGDGYRELPGSLGRGRCEDAPCCGCGGACGPIPGGYGYATVYTAY